MPLTLITGPANSGKARVVLEQARRHLARGAEPLLVVPTVADAERYRRELAGDEGVAMGVRVERFGGLIREVVARAGIERPPVSPFARERLIAGLVGRAGVAPPSGAQAGEGLVRALAELLAELQALRVSPSGLREGLRRALSDNHQAAGAEWPAVVFERYRAALAGLSRLDPEQRAVQALDALRERPALWGGTPVLFYGFDDLTPLQLDAIETLGRVVDAEVTVSLAYEAGRVAFAGRAGAFQALAPLAREYRTLEPRTDHYAPSSHAALGHLERSLFEADARRVDPADAVHLLEGGGERAELELVAERIARLTREGTPAEEIALVIRASPPTEELLEEVFTAAGVPIAMRRRIRFGDTAVGGALVGLLRSAEESGRTGDLLAWLRAPGILERPELADALELEARRQGVLTAAGAVALWEERRWPLEALARLREARRRGPLQLIARTERELGRLFAAPRKRLAAMLGPEKLQDAAALQAGQRALGELRELARGCPELVPASAAELADVLGALELPAGEPRQGAVAVLDPLALRARRVRALFLCALQEGIFPASQRAQPLLGEEERRRLAGAGGPRLPLPPDGLAAERYLFYAAVSRPEERLYLSWHAADEAGNPLARSLFVDDLCDLFQPSLVERTARRALGELGASVADEDGRPSPARPSGLAPLSEERVLASLRARPFSASSLEAWIGCPTKWFVERLLRPNAFEPDPEALARGGLAHAALKQTFEALRERTGTALPKPASLPLARELLSQALRENEPRHPLSVAPERLAAARRRLQVDLERYLARAAEMDGALEPTHLELGFGFPEEPDALPALELGEGVSLRGRIDRIDIGQGGEAVVYDYKGREAPPAARWLTDGKVQVALYMHAAEQLLGLRAVGGLYQPLAGSDGRPRGALDGEADVGIECVRGDALESSELTDLLREALGRAREAAAQAGRGELQARPATCAWGGGCAYPTICRCEG